MHSLVHPEVLEQREIQTVIARTVELRRRAPKRAVIRLTHGGCHWRARECRRVQPLIDIVRSGGYTLARDQERITTEAGSGSDGTTDSPWLSILKSENPVDAPTPEHSVYPSGAVGKEQFPMSDRQLISTTGGAAGVRRLLRQFGSSVREGAKNRRRRVAAHQLRCWCAARAGILLNSATIE